jgi:hypothetical protein
MDRSPADAESAGISGTFCVLPWVHLFVGEVGTLRPCCMALEAPELVNRDAAGKPYLIYQGSGIEQAWNSPFMRTLRVDLLGGARPTPCQRCFREEDLGIHSHRQYSNATFADSIPQVLTRTGPDGAAPADMIRSMDLRLGNRCNLKCRMCSPVSSRALLAEYAELYDVSPDDPRLLAVVGEDWVSDPNFLRTFEQCSAHAERLLFAGGEPLLVPEMTLLLQGLVDRGRSAFIDLEYVTNLTVLPEPLFALWAKFRSVGFVVSFDGLERIVEFIRHPLRWSRFERNLKLLDMRAKACGFTSLHANVTVQAYNVLHLEEAVTYLAEQLTNFGRPKLSLLFVPEHLSVRILPQALKQVARERLLRLGGRCRQDWVDRWPGAGAAELAAMIDGVIDYMDGADRTDLLPEFRRWTAVLDRSRHEDVTRAIPELAPLMA